MKVLRTLALTIALLSPLTGAPAQAANYLPGVGTVAVNGGGSAVTLAIPGRAGTPYRVQWLTNPYRLVVDLQGMWLGAPTSSIYIGMGMVKQIRAARHAGGITRVVFDLSGPADMRADNVNGSLVLSVMPRGVQAGAMAPMAPAYPGYPMAAPTRRPVPGYPGYPPNAYPAPDGRVTPLPVMPPMGWYTPPPSQQGTAPRPMPTQAPYQPPYQPQPMPSQAPYQPPQQQQNVPPPVPFSPEPIPEDDPIGELPSSERKAVFGSRVYAGGGMLLSATESYPAGNINASVSLVPNGEFGYEQAITPNIGVGLSGRLLGYTLSDDAAAKAGVDLLSKRDDMQFTAGIRGRFEIIPGLEIVAQPQGLYRMVNVTATVGPKGATGTTPADQSYYTSGYSNFGGGLGLGLGYRVLDFLSVVGTGEFNYLLGGMNQPTVATIMPLMNIGAGGEVRMDFSGFAASLGYKYTGYSNGGVNFSQSWHGPFLSVGYAY